MQAVFGVRADLQRVAPGSGDVAGVDIERVRVSRAIHDALAAWHYHGYDAAEQALTRLRAPAGPALAGRLRRARALSAGFAAWDRFDHAGALALLEPFAPALGDLAPLLGRLRLLGDENNPGREPALLLDLWLNAERRAAQGRYDDAVSRLYRLVEWSAQWLLKTRLDIDTADVPAARVPASLSLPSDADGRCQAGLMSAWRLLAHHLPDSAAGRWFIGAESGLRDRLLLRNGSILAHGYRPVSATQWHEFNAFFAGDFRAALIEECRCVGIRDAAQLPTREPASAPAADGCEPCTSC